MVDLEVSFVARLVQLESWGDVPTKLQYSVADPFCIRIVFGDDEIIWQTSRDLFAEGLEHPAGYADVRLWTAASSYGALFLHLKTNGKEALFELPRSTVAIFIRHVFRLVPAGAEQISDSELASILEGT